MIKWALNNWGNISSLIGLFISILVLFVSKGAKKAAEDGRRILEKRSLAGDLRSCMDDVTFINMLHEASKWELASHITYRLIQSVTFLQSRWNNYIDAETKQSINIIITQLDTMQDQFRKFITTAPSQSEIESLSQSIRRVTSLLTSETGKHESIASEK